MTITIPGFGELPPVDHTPDGVACWNTTAAGTSVSVLVEDPATTDDLDLPFIGSVLEDRERLLITAQLAVADHLREHPDYEAGAVADPEFTFHPGRDWLVRFAECRVPGFTELGIVVVFNGADVVGVDDLADVDLADD
ncbi:hypothetical protein ALI22I_29820 [Saccharothrix sp. ALI-22-I]|uniref:hypothetical protein n=1 Tax=Saccharothrix sp. ALI-22-I TaxID=1933778 RepID=UPI00097C099E|nr:hypothetical protein [Saccharothrix sp. ALI-22-I]ONI84713.1 hypothetical protein ALI22I_29820 [Saccharothrix sp. ALI-22-I]